MDDQRKKMRNIGLLIALSTPISGFISFAFVAIAIGEDRLEDANGTTSLGYAAIALPLVIGLTIAAIAHFGGPVPSGRRTAGLLAILGLVCIGIGASSVFASSAGDASIGGGLLVMFGLAALIVAAAVLFAPSSSQLPPPPPPQ